MELIQLHGSVCSGFGSSARLGNQEKKIIRSFRIRTKPLNEQCSLTPNSEVKVNARLSHLSNGCWNPKLVSSQEHTCRRHASTVISCHSSSSYGVGPNDAEETFPVKKAHLIQSSIQGIFGPGTGNIKTELLMLALPAIFGQAVEPLAQLMETAYIGRLGPVELASAGVSVSIFNIISKLFNVPLLSITTSFVAEDISRNPNRGSISAEDFQEKKNDRKRFSGDIMERKQLPSVSTALILATGIGIIEALALYFGAGLFINLMGISSASPMRSPAQNFLSLRALGAPAVVVSLAVQGIFRGFKDTTTPVLCVGVGNLSSVLLLPIFMYCFQMGITGAAIATVLSQYFMTFLLIWFLNKKAILLPPKMENLRFTEYIKSGGLLIGRTLSVLITMTLGTSMAARQGPLAMAAHQICFQVWVAVSLLSDALALSGQMLLFLVWLTQWNAMVLYYPWKIERKRTYLSTRMALIASSVSKGDYERVKEVTYFVLKAGVFTGICLTIVLGTWFGSLAELFTSDKEVLQIVRSGLLFVSASQPITALAFIFDGLHYGVSDFSYSAFSMMLVGVVSSTFLLYAPSVLGLPGVWTGLFLFMSLRMVAGFIRLASKRGPWWFLHDLQRSQISG